MHPFPHRYAVSAMAGPASVVTLRSAELEDIQSTAPPEFGGPLGSSAPQQSSSIISRSGSRSSAIEAASAALTRAAGLPGGRRVHVQGRLSGTFAEMALTDPAQAERFFGNRLVAGGGSWLPDGVWDGRRADRVAA